MELNLVNWGKDFNENRLPEGLCSLEHQDLEIIKKPDCNITMLV